MPMLHEYSPIRRSRNWTIMNVQSVLNPRYKVTPADIEAYLKTIVKASFQTAESI